MPDDDKTKAEKLAAAKRKVEQMKKAKAKKGGKKVAAAAAEEASSSKAEATEDAPGSPSKDTPTLAEQSKMRSASFRGTVSTEAPMSPSANPLSPDGETAPDIYRKQVATIEDLERENKRLTREATDAKKSLEKAEEELADLRDEDSDDSDEAEKGVVAKLKTEIAGLQRQNAQLQSQSSRPRHGSTASVSHATPPPAEVEALLQSKTSQIETMELEISRLKAQVLKMPPSSENEQVSALQEKLTRAEKAASKSQTELADLKKSLDRTVEKAVREGSGRSSAETAAANASREAEAATQERDEAVKRAEALDKKVTAMVGLHKEQDSRMQGLRKEKEALNREVDELRGRVSTLEKRLVKHGAEGEKLGEGGGLDDEGVDELEAEERERLNRRIRDLEAENYDLRRGIWHDKRKGMQTGPEESFQDVDLGGSGGVRSNARGSRPGGVSGGGLTDILASGLNAITGADQYKHQDQGPMMHGALGRAAGATEGAGLSEKAALAGDDGLLDDDFEFDEEAFRAAQQEENMRRLERVKEAKRALKNWEGFRLDLVDARRGGGEGIGEIFEV